MEWKQHLAWLAPFLATTVAFLAFYYGPRLARDGRLRRFTLALLVGSFGAASIAALFGALITKMSPVV